MAEHKVCEYDGAPRVYDAHGREDACPVCAAEIAAHNERCADCRMMAAEMEVRD